jgi:PAS domain S-box-containing protein
MLENPALERRRRDGADQTSIRAALAFGLVGLTWILVTDLVLVGIFHYGWEEIWPKSANQAVFVMFATVALFLLVRRYGRQLQASDATSRLSEEALRRSEWRYRSLVEQVPGVVWLNEVDREDPTRTHCVYAGPQLEDLLGYSPEEWMADDDLWQRVIHPDDLPGVLEENHLADAKGTLSMEYRAFRRDGGVVWIHDEAVLIPADEDMPAYWQGVMVDITAQRVQDVALHELTESLGGVFNASPLALIVLEPDGRVRHWNPAAERMFGWTAAEVVGGTLPYVPEHKKEEFERLMRQELAGGSIAGFETTRMRKDGTMIEVSLSVASLHDAEGRVAGMLGVVEDISERLAAHEALAERAEQLERLAQERQQMLHRIVRAQEEERERVALELHDGLGQVLTSISLFASDLEDEVPPEAKPRVVRVTELVRRAIGDSRKLVWSLRPPELERLGLVPAIRRLAEEVSVADHPVDLHEEIGDLRLPPESEAVVYRVVQEAVHNAQKHSRACAISILMRRSDGILTALVEDNGRGFEPESVPAGRGLGLVGMRERAELVDGDLVVESGIGTGTRIRLEVPIGGRS